jgi:hypothetical protein
MITVPDHLRTHGVATVHQAGVTLQVLAATLRAAEIAAQIAALEELQRELTMQRNEEGAKQAGLARLLQELKGDLEQWTTRVSSASDEPPAPSRPTVRRRVTSEEETS